MSEDPGSTDFQVLSDVLYFLNSINLHIDVICLCQTRCVLLPKDLLQVLEVALPQNQLLLKVVSNALHFFRRFLNSNLSAKVLRLIEFINSFKKCTRKALLLVAGKD